MMMLQDTARHIARTSLVALAATALLSPAALADGKLAIKAGKIFTEAGADPIENGVIVIEDGRITAVGPNAKVPWDATVIDASGMTAFPGFVEAYSPNGMDRANENIDVAPFLDVRDSIDPVSFYFEDSLRWGVTTINVQQGPQCVIGGQGRVVKPRGMTVEAMTVKTNSGIVLSASPKRGNSNATQAQALRNAFGDLRRELEDLVQQKRNGDDTSRREAMFQGREFEGEEAKGRAMSSSAWTVEGLDLVPRGEIDEKLEPLLRLVEGDVPAFFYCATPMNVHQALDVARDNGFLARTTLVLGSACWKAADVIAEAGVPVVLSSRLVHSERDPVTGEQIETFVPGVFAEKGVRFALSSSNSSTESLWYNAAMAVGLGLSRDQAIEAVTTAPAAMLGLGKRVGSLAVGKDGNVVLFSGDPLSVTSFVERVVVEGEDAYDRSKDVRMKHLVDGVQPMGTAAASELDEVGHVHEDPEVPEDEEAVDAGEEQDEESGDEDPDEHGDHGENGEHGEGEDK